jgi:hypothetical protein
LTDAKYMAHSLVSPGKWKCSRRGQVHYCLTNACCISNLLLSYWSFGLGKNVGRCFKVSHGFNLVWHVLLYLGLSKLFVDWTNKGETTMPWLRSEKNGFTSITVLLPPEQHKKIYHHKLLRTRYDTFQQIESSANAVSKIQHSE